MRAATSPNLANAEVSDGKHVRNPSHIVVGGWSDSVDSPPGRSRGQGADENHDCGLQPVKNADFDPHRRAKCRPGGTSACYRGVDLDKLPGARLSGSEPGMQSASEPDQTEFDGCASLGWPCA